jgi:hypothetical protein
MAKQSGLGDRFFISGVDVSGDINSLGNIHGGHAMIDVTDITQSAMDRIGGIRDGGIEFTSYMNDSTGRAHKTLRALPTADVAVSYLRGTGIGSPMCSCVAKQVNYDLTRTDAGELTFVTAAQANAFGVEWGDQLTAGIRTDTTATSPATGLDTTASLSFGLQAYLHVFAFTGTSVTVTLQDSADNATFAAIGGGVSFAAASAVGAQRIATVNTQTVRRYVRAITTGTFTNAQFAVQLTKNQIAGQVF